MMEPEQVVKTVLNRYRISTAGDPIVARDEENRYRITRVRVWVHPLQGSAAHEALEKELPHKLNAGIEIKVETS